MVMSDKGCVLAGKAGKGNGFADEFEFEFK